MTIAPQSVAVVATRLPLTDRRALSQAWYSALHVAQPQAPASPPRRSTAGAAATAAHAQKPAAGTVPVAPRSQRQGTLGTGGIGSAPGAFVERRTAANDLTRRLERALARHAAPAAARSATIAVKAAEGRIQLIVRGQADSTRVIAICAPHLRERVDRALAHACFALAASGTRLESVDVRGSVVGAPGAGA